ncbi:transcription factor [Pseudohyphozyma bogoriensis]|nr:transcription factor [Pseudohyphozyma bogoriensis]
MALPHKASSRSQFIVKLHETLENAQHPLDLHWCGNDTFEITASDDKAREALSPSWDFRSLSSFIRQLSYYGHPSGFFLRDDKSQLDRIVRKTRARKPKGAAARRKQSMDEALSDERSPTPEMYHQDDVRRDSFPGMDTYRPVWTPTVYNQQPALNRQKPALTLPLHTDNGGAHQLDQWHARTSPYPTPIGNSFSSNYFPAQPTTSHSSHAQHNPHQQSYFAPAPAPSAPQYHAPSHTVGHYDSGMSYGRGAIGAAPPSPTSDHSHGGNSDDGGEHHQPTNYYAPRKLSTPFFDLKTIKRPNSGEHLYSTASQQHYGGMGSFPAQAQGLTSSTYDR